MKKSFTSYSIVLAVAVCSVLFASPQTDYSFVREFGEEGRKIEEEMVQVAKEYGIRFIGPNCIGAINMENGFCVPFPRRQIQEKLPLPVCILLCQPDRYRNLLRLVLFR